jgi:serine protease Do
MTPESTQSTAATGDPISQSAPTGRKPNRTLLAGALALALLASGSAYTLHAYSTELGSPFGARSAARAPTAPVAMPGFTDLVAAVKPAVVSVRVKADVAANGISSEDGANPFEGTPFEKYFKNFRGPGGPQPRQFVQGQGSGFFISADGYIVTNNHVVDHAVSVEILTDSGKSYSAKVVGADAKSDLALIKVDGGKDFPFVRLAEASPQIGEWVVAMGNPFGLGGTVTAGIVSAQGRDIGSGSYDDYIQIDAPVNRGNSGGPTFNLKGEVIGVNTAIYSPSGGSVGIAFDIPASTVASVVPQLRKSGHVARGWLGVQIQPVTQEIADSLGLKAARGALVAEPQPGSPAAAAGVKAGDIIIGVDGTEVKDARDLARKVGTLAPHRSIELRILRNGMEQTAHLRLGQMSEAQAR